MSIPFLHIEAKGSYGEIGRQVGEAARELIAAAIAFYEEHFLQMSGISFAEAERQALAYLPAARRYLPQYVDELAGMAAGANLPFVKLLVPNCAEEFTCPADADAGKSTPGGVSAAAYGDAAGQNGATGSHLCTAVAVSSGGRHVVGHNMDWYVVDVDKNVLFDLTCPDGTRILTIAGVPYLPILGMNSHGIAYVGNSVYSNDNRLGVPNAFVRRFALEARTVGEARARATLPARARGSNHLFGDVHGHLWDVETSATASELLEGEFWLAHTNHYAGSHMQVYEGSRQQESRARLATAERLLAEGVARGDDPLDLVARVLRDHSDAPESICGHENTSLPVADRVMTVASMVCDLDERRLYACAGTPCENGYQVFSL
ncbi:MAG: C45 family autoproteolytic acyltransferase/hydolase [Thermoleophilia bacterium]